MEKYHYDDKEVITCSQFGEYSEILAFYAEQNDTQKALNIYDDVKKLAFGGLNNRVFIELHPEFIYRWGALESLKQAIINELK